MNVGNLQDLPQAALEEIFSHLPTQDLVSAAKTCRACNAAQKAEWLWKNRCHVDLHYGAKLCDSWKEQYARIVRNLASGGGEVAQVLQDPRFLNSPFTVLDDGTTLVVCQDRIDSPSVSVRSVKSDSVVPIDMSTYGRVLGSCTHGSLWTVLTEAGEIATFNLLTGACERQIPCKDIDLNQWMSGPVVAVLSRTGSEIAVWTGERVCIWNAQSGALSQELSVQGTVRSICITPNFVVCRVQEEHAGEEIIRAINRADLSSLEVDRCSRCEMTFSDTRVAYVMDTGVVRVLVDEPEAGLVRKQSFSCRPDRFATLSLGKKFLCVAADRNIFIFNLCTGTILGMIPGVRAINLAYKEQTLFVRTISNDECCSHLYDFGRSAELIRRNWK